MVTGQIVRLTENRPSKSDGGAILTLSVRRFLAKAQAQRGRIPCQRATTKGGNTPDLTSNLDLKFSSPYYTITYHSPDQRNQISHVAFACLWPFYGPLERGE